MFQGENRAIRATKSQARESERVAIIESKIDMIETEINELVSRKTPWIQIITMALGFLIPVMGFGFQNLLQLQIISERQIQYQRDINDIRSSTQEQIKALALEDKETRARVNALEHSMEKRQ